MERMMEEVTRRIKCYRRMEEVMRSMEERMRWTEEEMWLLEVMSSKATGEKDEGSDTEAGLRLRQPGAGFREVVFQILISDAAFNVMEDQISISVCGY